MTITFVLAVLAVGLLHLLFNLCFDAPVWVYDGELGLESVGRGGGEARDERKA